LQYLRLFLTYNLYSNRIMTQLRALKVAVRNAWDLFSQPREKYVASLMTRYCMWVKRLTKHTTACSGLNSQQATGKGVIAKNQVLSTSLKKINGNKNVD
jgi:hypothetical protein